MGWNLGSKTITRIWQFVDQFVSGEDATRANFDTAFNDVVSGTNDAIAYLISQIEAAASSELYLGVFESPPSTNNEGDDLVEGNVYIRAPEYVAYVYDADAAAWRIEGQFATASAYFKGLVGASDAAALRNLLGLGTAAVSSASSFATPASLAPISELVANGFEVAYSFGVGNDFTITSSDPIAAYVEGQAFLVRMLRAPTGASTLNVDGIGAKTLGKFNTGSTYVAIEADDWVAGSIIPVYYDGTRFLVPNFALDNSIVHEQSVWDTGTNTTDAQISPAKLKATINDHSDFPRVRAQCVIDGTGTASVSGGFNIASITDNGTGDWDLNFTDDMPNANYIVQVTLAPRVDSRTVLGFVGTRSTGSVQILAMTNAAESSTPTAYDHDEIHVTVFA